MADWSPHRSSKFAHQPSAECMEDRVLMAARLPIVPASAVTVTLDAQGNASGAGAINSNSEVDYFTFKTPVAGDYVIDISTPNSNLDTVLATRVGTLSKRVDNVSASNTDSKLAFKAKANTQIIFAVSKASGTSMLGAYNWSVDGPANPQVTAVPAAPASLISAPKPATTVTSAAVQTPTAAKTQTLSLNQQVLNFAAASVGQKLGNGQCTGLIQQALTKVGAKGVTIQNGKYAWGSLAKTVTPGQSASGIQAGDILQMYNVRFQGAWPSGGTYSTQAVQHTVIVKSVSGNQVEVYEQNANDVQVVTQGWYNLSDLRAGTIYAYRPVQA